MKSTEAIDSWMAMSLDHVIPFRIRCPEGCPTGISASLLPERLPRRSSSREMRPRADDFPGHRSHPTGIEVKTALKIIAD